MSREVFVLPTGAANLRSVEVMLERLGRQVRLVDSVGDIESNHPLVLPGVGAFGPAMDALRSKGWDQAIIRRIQDGKPTLGICLGMQLLLEGSEEDPDVPGLSLAEGVAGRFAGVSRVPQMGWNGGYYFANSFRLATAPAGWECTWREFGSSFVAMMRRGRVWACQFHPELSGPAGQALVEAWLEDRGLFDHGEGNFTRRIIPCLDVRDGRVVKGVRFQGLRDAGDPVAQAQKYEKDGADEIVILDVSATPEGRSTAIETVRSVRNAIGIPITVGGGICEVDDALTLLTAGADKVAVNTAAVSSPSLLSELADRFGRQCVVIAIDAKKVAEGWTVVTHSGKTETGLDAIGWAEQAAGAGAGEILLTSWDRDGTHAGYDLELLRAVSRSVEVPVIASGGGSTAADMDCALASGADAVLAASIFHDNQTTVRQIKSDLASFGWEVRR